MECCDHCNYYKNGICLKEDDDGYVDVQKCQDEYDDYLIDEGDRRNDR